MLDLLKPLRTIMGNKAYIYNTRGEGYRAIQGIVRNDRGDWQVEVWDADGHAFFCKDGSSDLENAPEGYLIVNSLSGEAWVSHEEPCLHFTSVIMVFRLGEGMHRRSTDGSWSEVPQWGST